MGNTLDLLKIKIEKARGELSEESRNAIDAVNWKLAILEMRAEKGYSFTQIEDLEIETELLLCGLLSPVDYPKELETRMGLPKPQVDILINEMNEKVFKRIREELVKIIERKKTSENNQTSKITDIPKKEEKIESREKLLEKIENPSANKTEKPVDMINRLESEKELPAPPEEKLIGKIPSILEQKLSGSFRIPTVETEHTLSNISKDTDVLTKPKIPNIDPYREIPQ